jgi:hypothetical protein
VGEKVSATQLAARMKKTPAMTMAEIQEFLGGVSAPTAYRRLIRIGYRRSYNHNGKYYMPYDEGKFDDLGLYSYRGARFSVDGNLTDTVRRLVQESENGYSQRELQELLGIRVQNTLWVLIDQSQVIREKTAGVYVYLHPTRQRKRAQLRSRAKHLERLQKEAQEKAAAGRGVPLEIVVEVLLTLIRHPSSDVAAVVRRLEGRSPPISTEQIRWVFDRYQLGQRGGSKS